MTRMNGVVIREAGEDDVPALVALLLEVIDLHAAALPRIYQRVAADRRLEAYMRETLAAAGSHIIVAEHAGEIVGYVSLTRRSLTPVPFVVPRASLQLDTVVVRAALRRRGIGEALMTWIETWAMAQGIDTMDLVVAEFNTAAIGLYEKLGYTTVWRRMRRSLPGDPPEGRAID